MKPSKYTRCRGVLGSVYTLDRTMSEISIASDARRNMRYYSLERAKCPQSAVNHFYHRPYAKWEGRV